MRNLPPKPVYPLDIDDNYTLYLVYNTTESLLSVDNEPWSEEIDIVPAVNDEVWADNGFGNINGELFYYDAVTKNTNNKIIKLRKCIRNLGGTQTQYNSINGGSVICPRNESVVRGLVVAEHHNQLLETIYQLEKFIGYNYDSNQETLDFRIRCLKEVPLCSDDFCVTVNNFTINILSGDACVGIDLEYNIVIEGSYTQFLLDFGDGNQTSSTLLGTHHYAPDAKIDPILIVTSSKCQLIQTPTIRAYTTFPKIAIEAPFQIPIPECPDFPPISFIDFTVSIPDVQIPPILFPCISLSPTKFPSIDLLIDALLNFPSIIEFGPINIPSMIEFGSINIPSMIEFGPINIPSMIMFGPVNIPSMIMFGPVNIPSMIMFGPVNIPNIINFGPLPNFPSMIEFGPVDIPSMIEFGPVDIPSMIEFSPIDIPSMIEFSPVDIPSMIEFGPINIPSMIEFGKSPTITSIIEFGKAPTISDIKFEKAPTITDIKFEKAPTISAIKFEKAPTIDPIEFGPVNIPSIIEFGPVDIPSVIEFGKINIPSIIEFGKAPTISDIKFEKAPTIADIKFETPPPITATISVLQPSWPAIQVDAPLSWPAISITKPDWSLNCTVSVNCPSTTPAPAFTNPVRPGRNVGGVISGFTKGEEFTTRNQPQIEIDASDLINVGIPSQIEVIAPTLPKAIKLEHNLPDKIQVDAINVPQSIKLVHSLPEVIRIISDFNIPNIIQLTAIDIPKTIELVAKSIPESIKLEVPSDFPKSIFLDATGIPESIKVTGIPETITLIHNIPSEIYLRKPDDFQVDMVYRGAPIDVNVKVDMNLARLVGSDDLKSPCVMLVPCPQN